MMKVTPRAAFALLLLCLLLCLTVPAAFAETGLDGGEVIVGFEELPDGGVLRVDHKYALPTLEKRLPAELNVLLEGGVSRSIGVSWKCLDDYDKSLDAFRFVPVPDGAEPAGGLEPPVLTVIVEESFTAPPNGFVPDETPRDVPILGAVSGDGTPILRGDLPASYNSYEAGMLPPLHDQGQYGTCWAFAALGAMEADMIHDRAAGTDIDLSELHLAYFVFHSFYDEKNCNEGDSVSAPGLTHLNDGGNFKLARNTLCNMVGGATEADVPYGWAADYFPSAYAGRAYDAPQLTAAYEINTYDLDGLKSAIMAHGGIAAAMNMDDVNYYSSTCNSYYTTESGTNHAVMLVGWDDSFPKENFRDDRAKPSADGAWLVRNSWGVDDYDLCGYFWMSYEDAGFHSWPAAAFEAQPQAYRHCYGYDAGLFPQIEYICGSSATESQRFLVDGGERIEAVGFETQSGQLDVEITLSRGDQSVSAVTYAVYPGFYLVPLETPLEVPFASEVTLSITLTGNDAVTIPTQGVGADYYGAARFEAACAGGGVVIDGENKGTDGRLKLYTNDYDASVAVNEENFPNPSFRAYVSARIDLDRSKSLSPEEIAAVKAIDISGGEELQPDSASAEEDGESGQATKALSASAWTLKGLEYFTALESLSCDYNRLAGLDLSGNAALKNLSCTHNNLTSLDLSPCPALAALVDPETFLSAEEGVLVFSDAVSGAVLRVDSRAKLTPSLYLGTGVSIAESFPDESFRAWVSKNCDIDGDGTLVDLEIRQVTAIDISSSAAGPVVSLQGVGLFTALRELNCSNNASLTSLDVSGCTALEILLCYNCDLESLTIGSNPALRELYCRENRLESLDLSGCAALWDLSCRNNRLTALDLSGCSALSVLYCNANLLTDLDLTDCPILLTLLETAQPTEAEAVLYLSDGRGYMRYDRDLAMTPCLPDLILPEGLTEIGGEAFAGSGFAHARLSGKTVKVGARAFADCPALAFVCFPAETVEIDPLAFGDRETLTIIGLPDSSAEAFARDHGFAFAALG